VFDGGSGQLSSGRTNFYLNHIMEGVVSQGKKEKKEDRTASHRISPAEQSDPQFLISTFCHPSLCPESQGRDLIRHPPRVGSADATFPVRGEGFGAGG
jgi:hypothetical protein